MMHFTNAFRVQINMFNCHMFGVRMSHGVPASFNLSHSHLILNCYDYKHSLYKGCGWYSVPRMCILIAEVTGILTVAIWGV